MKNLKGGEAMERKEMQTTPAGRVSQQNQKGGEAMTKKTLEKVAVLKKGTETITIWREPFDWAKWRGETPRYFIEQGGELQPFQAFKGRFVPEHYCPTPELLEGWIEEKLREGYTLELEIEKLKYPDDKTKINGEPLDIWYGSFLTYAEGEEGRLYEFRNVRELLSCIFDVPVGDFPEYWTLLLWERERMKEIVADVVVERWEKGEVGL
jgi:hypothetical protein